MEHIVATDINPMCDMIRSYGSLMVGDRVGWIKIHPYKMGRADGSAGINVFRPGYGLR